MTNNRTDSMIEEFIKITTKRNNDLDFGELLRLVIQSALNIAHADWGVLYLLDQTKENLVAQSKLSRLKSEIDPDFESIPLYIDGERNVDNPVNYSVFTNEILNIKNIYKYTGFDINEFLKNDKVTNSTSRSISMFPLSRNKTEIMGVLLLINYRDPISNKSVTLSIDKLDALTMFSSKASVAVDNYLLSKRNKQLVSILSRNNESLEKENAELKKIANKKYDFSSIIGQGSAMKKVYSLMEKITDSSATVLIRGNTGTGKELVAQALHYNSYRRCKPFVIQNCAALPDNLLESELFGYRKGAFSGAISDKKGLIEQAEGGTIFLDEIGDMPMALQAKILRVIQDKTVRPLGSNESMGKKVDVRIIAATHCDLQSKIDRGEFREDLYYRLSVFPIKLPSLKQRLEDIPELIQYFVIKMAEKYQKAIVGISPAALKCLYQYHYPGNIRDLMNIIERSVLMADNNDYINESHLPEELTMSNECIINCGSDKSTMWTKVVQHHMQENATTSLKEIVANFEAGIIRLKLEQCHWNQTKAAKELSIARRTIIDKMTRYGIGQSLGQY